jgi:acyl dehydratase
VRERVGTRTLESPPSALPAYLRAGLGAIPGAGRLPFLAGGGGEIPDLELALDEVEVDRERLAAYCHVCGFTLATALPPTYPHVLAFPLHMALLTDPSFPFSAIGMVHVANRIVQRRPIGLGEGLSLRVRGANDRPHPKGRTFDIVTEALVGGELVWEATSTNLRRGGGDESAPAREGPEVQVADLATEAEWKLAGDLGRRYADVSGDRNPIHLYGLTAKAFGFPRQIAHGMWTKARSLAQLEPRLPDALAVEVAFKKPILLPGKVEFASESRGPQIAFGVRDARKGVPHLAGTVSPAT